MDPYPTKAQLIGALGEKEWKAIERARTQKAQTTGLRAKNDKPFRLVLIPEMLTLISEVSQDKGFLSSLKLPQNYLRTRSHQALKKEAYYSSRIEGAVTSLETALRNLGKKKKDFVDESMQMIYNNKLALEFMHRHKAEPFSEKMIRELHRILLYNTHKARPITVGQYRKGPIYIVDGQGRVVYEGPPPDKASRMMGAFIHWMNQKPSLHPLVDAALVHLYFVHVHPFDDGNGRSARALSNLYLEKNGFSFIHLLSTSDYFEHHKSAYYHSIQAAETHDHDATFFVLYYLKALKSQLENVRSELEKEGKVKDIKRILDRNVWAKLHKRQLKALRWMMESDGPVSTRKYCKLNQCSDETARKDFNVLQSLKLIKPEGSGRSTKYFLTLETPD